MRDFIEGLFISKELFIFAHFITRKLTQTQEKKTYYGRKKYFKLSN